MSRPAVRFALAAMVLLAGAPAARAAEPKSLGVKPFTLTTDTRAKHPNVGVDDMLAGHVVWDVSVDGGPDPVHYCRVPRGSTACQAQQEFPLPLESFDAPHVFTPAPGQVVLLTYRCCGNGEGTYAIISGDGGNTWAAPKLVGKIALKQAVYGPGTNVVSMVDDVVTAGIHFQAAPLDGYTDKTALLGDGFALQGYDGTIGFPTPTYPIVAFDDLHHAFWREWSGSGDINDASTWNPTRPIPGPLTEVRMATGFKGVVLMGKEHYDNPYRDIYTVRRFDTTVGDFVATSTPLNDPAVEKDVIFRDIFEDPGGNIAAVWIANGVHAGRTDPMRYRVSTDGGKTWQAERTLVAATNDLGFNLQIGAAGDGGGFVVYDRNGKGPLSAVPIPKVVPQGGGAGGTCVPSVTFGNVEALAVAGCLLKKPDGTYRTPDPVRLNGVDLVPHAGGMRAHTAAAPGITIDPAHKAVHIDSADIRAGDVLLDKGSFDWKVGPGAVFTFTHLETYAKSLFNFPVVGEGTLSFGNKSAEVPVHFKLPSMFGGVNGDATLHMKNPQKADFTDLKIKVGTAFLGILQLKLLEVTYTGSQPPRFEGTAEFVLPPSLKVPAVHVAFGFENGAFKHAEGQAAVKIPIDPPFVYINEIGLALSDNPLKIAGGLSLSGGPKVGDQTVIELKALPPGGGFSFTLSDPGVLAASGQLKVVSIPFASGGIEFRTNGVFKFAGGFDFTVPLGLARVEAGIPSYSPGPGVLYLDSGNFNAPISGSVCLPASCFIKIGAQGVVSTKGIAACGEYHPAPEVTVSAGVGYKWGGSIETFLSGGGCAVGPYKVSARRRSAHAAQAGATVSVKPGLAQENIVVEGVGGAPRITVAGPGGETVTSNPDGTPADSEHMVVYSAAEANRTFVLIGRPPAGAYSVSALPGSPAIASVRHADGLPEPRVSARVSGRRYHRVLRWEVGRIPGQSVRFAERSARADGDIGTAKGSRGKLRFRPAEGPAGRREIVALIDQDGIPRTQLVVARYTAPPPQRPARPRRVRLRRAGASVVVRWARVARAARYVVRIRLHDGTSRLYVVSGAKRSLKLRGVPRRTFGSVTVAALTRSNLAGRAGKAKVRRAVKRPRRHRRA